MSKYSVFPEYTHTIDCRICGRKDIKYHLDDPKYFSIPAHEGYDRFELCMECYHELMRMLVSRFRFEIVGGRINRDNDN